MSEAFDQKPLEFLRLDPEEMRARASEVYNRLQSRRTVRHFSSDPLPMDVVEECIRAASTAPSGANKQPWHFCVVTDSAIKSAIREAAEKEEYLNYHGRMSEEWLDELRQFGTDHVKPHLEVAPALIVVFRQSWSLDATREGKSKNYYVQESVGLACGMLLAALHECGIATLTHTPSPMDFLGQILNRPPNEKAFLLIPIGYPTEGCQVPDIQRKRVEEVVTYYGSDFKKI
ncbi:MAG: nitroreductase family protein [Bacteroidetes bacterium]|nr:nitroreductase family protein [Bacteroidota bacterium]